MPKPVSLSQIARTDGRGRTAPRRLLPIGRSLPGSYLAGYVTHAYTHLGFAGKADMALTNAEKQRRYRERNVVVLTRSAKDIAETMTDMDDQKKLQRVVAYLSDYLKMDYDEKAIWHGRLKMLGLNGRLSKTEALAKYAERRDKPAATSSWLVEAIGDLMVAPPSRSAAG